MKKILILVIIFITVGALFVFSHQPSQSFQDKVSELQTILSPWIIRHPGQVGAVQKLMQQFRSYVEKKDFTGAEKIVDQVLAILKSGATPESSTSPGTVPPAPSGTLITKPTLIRLSNLSPHANLIFHEGGHIWTMDNNGGNVTQITFGKARKYEHVAVSYDHRFIVSNVHDDQGNSHLLLYDLARGAEASLLPDFYDAGDGGVSFDLNGYIYFVGKPKQSDNLRDLFKVKPDGTSLIQLTHTPDRQECDPGASEDGTLVVYCINFPDPAHNTAHTEIWVINANGINPRQVYVGGEILKASVHDPELSSDNTRAIFSKVNSSVKPNFANDKDPGTAHDLWSINLNGTDLRRLTAPGPISIVPNVHANKVVYTELSEQDGYAGASVVNLDGRDQLPRHLYQGGAAAKWVPPMYPNKTYCHSDGAVDNACL